MFTQISCANLLLPMKLGHRSTPWLIACSTARPNTMCTIFQDKCICTCSTSVTHKSNAIIEFKYNNANKTNNHNNYNNQYSTYRQTDTVDSYLIVIIASSRLASSRDAVPCVKNWCSSMCQEHFLDLSIQNWVVRGAGDNWLLQLLDLFSFIESLWLFAIIDIIVIILFL